MSEDTDEGADAGDDTGEPDADLPDTPDEQALVERLDDAAAAVEAAETEADLDRVAATLAAVETGLEEAELPVPDDDEAAPAERLEGRLADVRDEIDARRGPYLEDVLTVIEEAETTVADSEWTEDGQQAAVGAVETYLSETAATVDVDITPATEDPAGAADALGRVHGELADHSLHPDDDAEAIEELLTAVETLRESLESAEVWSDLTVREQLAAEGFYDVLDPKNRKDFPPEWNAVKIYEKRGEVEPMLRALESFGSDFMEENVLDALEHIAPKAAFDAVHERAQRRNKQCVRILGRIGDERACGTLVDFLDGGDTKLELITLQALGAIGSRETTQAVANRLIADDPEIRSTAARALGLIGDTRAVEPLSDVLSADSADEVRASAAWALNQIGTERARSAAAAYVDDRSYLVQAEAEKATGA